MVFLGMRVHPYTSSKLDQSENGSLGEFAVTTVEMVVQKLRLLPEVEQQEVLDFVEFLKFRRNARGERTEDVSWSEFSLTSAMHGMEEEDTPYTLTDLKESFR